MNTTTENNFVFPNRKSVKPKIDKQQKTYKFDKSIINKLSFICNDCSINETAVFVNLINAEYEKRKNGNAGNENNHQKETDLIFKIQKVVNESLKANPELSMESFNEEIEWLKKRTSKLQDLVDQLGRSESKNNEHKKEFIDKFNEIDTDFGEVEKDIRALEKSIGEISKPEKTEAYDDSEIRASIDTIQSQIGFFMTEYRELNDKYEYEKGRKEFYKKELKEKGKGFFDKAIDKVNKVL